MPLHLPFGRGPRREKAPADVPEDLLLKKPEEGKFIAHFPEDEHHPAYWKVSSATGTTRVFGEGSLQVPDSAMHSGETDVDWRVRMLQRDLQALASDPETLMEAYDARVPIVYDLVNDFAIRLECVLAVVGKGQKESEVWNSTRSVEAKLRELPDLKDSSRWTVEGLRRSPTWTEVRLLAQSALSTMGCVRNPPPPRSM